MTKNAINLDSIIKHYILNGFNRRNLEKKNLKIAKLVLPFHTGSHHYVTAIIDFIQNIVYLRDSYPPTVGTFYLRESRFLELIPEILVTLREKNSKYFAKFEDIEKWTFELEQKRIEKGLIQSNGIDCGVYASLITAMEVGYIGDCKMSDAASVECVRAWLLQLIVLDITRPSEYESMFADEHSDVLN